MWQVLQWNIIVVRAVHWSLEFSSYSSNQGLNAEVLQFALPRYKDNMYSYNIRSPQFRLFVFHFSRLFDNLFFFCLSYCNQRFCFGRKIEAQEHCPIQYERWFYLFRFSGGKLARKAKKDRWSSCTQAMIQLPLSLNRNDGIGGTVEKWERRCVFLVTLPIQNE